MDKEFEKKVRMKKIRAAVVVLLILAAAAYLIWDMEFEKADYGQALKDEIAAAEELCKEKQAFSGNEADQYAPYTILNFQKQIETAKAVSEDKNSAYHTEKEAYELLKDQEKAFKKAKNKDVISREEAKQLASKQDTKEYEVDFKGEEKLHYTISGADLKKAVAMNLTAQEKGPYFDDISTMLSEMKLSGQVVSFYQEGTFGGKLKVTAPMYSKKSAAGYAYKVDLKKGKLQYVSDAKIDKKSQTAAFHVTDGGDYVVVTKKLHKDGQKKSVDIKEVKKEAKSGKSGGKTGSGGEAAGNKEASGGGQPAEKPQAKKIDVTIEIRCDTLAQDLSKLEDPALEAYVPADGTILPTTKVTVKEGTTVFDVLNQVCRDKGIQVESMYTPAYGSYYVEGINYLYEFSGGKLSGWMYKVNGWFPNYGCSSYTLKDGDTIVWCYTCDLGNDVGGGAATGG